MESPDDVGACDPVYLTPADLAVRWLVTTRTLERYRSAGSGPAWISVGGTIRYALTAVLAYEARQSGVPARPSNREGADEPA